MRNLRILLTLCLALLGSQAMADTYVFVTNSTPDTVTVSVNHHGTATLTQGSQWEQEATSIGPYETKRVLRYNRFWGVTRNRTFNFDTTISSGTSSVVLRQTMVGTWTGSNIQHGASGPGFTSPWFSDRNVHTCQHDYATRPSSTAFKAEFTGGYDDFYYIITNDTPVEPLSGDDALKVLSYNIYALPLVASKISERLAEVIKDGKAYHLTSTHTASFDTEAARALRQVQFQQIRALVDSQNIPAFDAVLMGGDFNVNKLIWPQDYADMLTNLNATDPVSTGYTAATFDPRINILATAAGSGGDTVEYLDYVVYANDHRQPVQSRNDVRIKRAATAPLFHTRDLSDHFPVMGEFQFAP